MQLVAQLCDADVNEQYCDYLAELNKKLRSGAGSKLAKAESLGVTPSVTQVIDGDALLCDATGNLVRGHDRPVVLLGVEGLAVIDAGDALLVASLERSDEVREVVSLLRKRGRRDLL